MRPYGSVEPAAGPPPRGRGRRLLPAALAACLVLATVAILHTSMRAAPVAMFSDEGDTTTGRVLTRDSIASAGVEASGATSNEELTVLNDAASLHHAPRPTQAQIEAARVLDSIEGAAQARDRRARDDRTELNSLNEGYAKEMQRFLTGDAAVGDVDAAIDRRDASYLRHTHAYRAALPAHTLEQILHTAEQQKAREDRGLVAPEGVADARARAQLGLVHSPDGYVLSRAGGAAAEKATMQVLDLIDGCKCEGTLDEDRGPRCSCMGEPHPQDPKHVFSDAEVTRWVDPAEVARIEAAKVKKAAEKAKKEAEEKAEKEADSKKGKNMNGGKSVRVEQTLAEAVEARGGAGGGSVDDLNEGLQVLLEKAAARAKTPLERHSLVKLSKTVHALQQCLLEDPQSRDLIAEKLDTLVSGGASKTQSLLDKVNVYVVPNADDLDQYLQGVITEVDQTEIPNISDAVTKDSKGTQNLAQVLPAPDDINAFLSTILRASYDQHSPKASDTQGVQKMAKLKATVHSLAQKAAEEPASRDLIARRLGQLRGAFKQSLLDKTNVDIVPNPEDLDTYLQGLITEIDQTEIPNISDVVTKSRMMSLMPLPSYTDVYDKYKAPRHGDYKDKMQWQKHPWNRENPEDRNPSHKVNVDRFEQVDNKFVQHASTLVKGGVTNPYGWEGAKGEDVEAPVATANGPDTARATGVQTEWSLHKGAKLCQLGVNCDDNIFPFPRAANGVRKNLLSEVKGEDGMEEGKEGGGEEAAEENPDAGRPDLGDEIFGVGVVDEENQDDVIIPSDDPSLINAYYMARRPPAHTPFMRQQLLLRSSQSTAPQKSYGVPLPLA